METIIKRPRKHDIVFHRSGRIDILSRVAKLLDIHDGDSINIAFDRYERYLFIDRKAGGIGRIEGVCRPTKFRSHNFRAYSKTICEAMLSFIEADTNAGFWCGDAVTINTRTYIPIITNHAL